MSDKQKTILKDLPVYCIGVKVKGTRKEDLEFALRTLKKKMKDCHIVEQLMERKQYEKPSVIKRSKKLRAIRKQKISDNGGTELG